MENCLFLKQIEDAANLRKGYTYNYTHTYIHTFVFRSTKSECMYVCMYVAIVNCFERANVPNLNEEEIRDALSFVVVGAGPTGM